MSTVGKKRQLCAAVSQCAPLCSHVRTAFSIVRISRFQTRPPALHHSVHAASCISQKLRVKEVGMWRYIAFLQFQEHAFQRRQGREISCLGIVREGESLRRSSDVI